MVAVPKAGVVRFPVARPVAVAPAVAVVRFPVARPAVADRAVAAARFRVARPVAADRVAVAAACPAWAACTCPDVARKAYLPLFITLSAAAQCSSEHQSRAKAETASVVDTPLITRLTSPA